MPVATPDEQPDYAQLALDQVFDIFWKNHQGATPSVAHDLDRLKANVKVIIEIATTEGRVRLAKKVMDDLKDEDLSVVLNRLSAQLIGDITDNKRAAHKLRDI